MQNKPIKTEIIVKETHISVIRVDKTDFISLTDLAKYQNSSDPSLYILQFAINILMNINLGIETNVNLPFVSDQGIYFVINSICLAVILSIYRKKNINNCEKIAA